MSDHTRLNAKALSLMIVSLMALGGVSAVLGLASPPARAAACDQGATIISGDWTITTPQVCSGILYTVDGSITINAGGSLTLVNGGLSFAKDVQHQGYALTVNAGGSLTLDHSIVTMQRTLIQPVLKLAFTVTGGGSSFSMTDGSVLKFPGWFNATGATITMTDSSVTGFTPGELTGTGVYPDDNDDSPIMSWSSTTATLFRSQIQRIYENTSAIGNVNATGPIEANLSLTSSSTLTAYDSFIGVDYSNVLGLHNEVRVDGTSNAYLYNVTIDRTEDPIQETDWQPAFVPTAAGGNIYLMRWLHATIVDSTGWPVSGATIWSALSPARTTAQYPDNSLGTTPSSQTLNYLGRTASGANAWNTTDANGRAMIPLYTDQITITSLPNANSLGNYQLTAAFGSSTAPGGVNFNPYPAVDATSNNAWVTIPMSSVTVRTGPDLALLQSEYPGTLSELVGQNFDVTAHLHNLGQTQATGVSIAAWLDGNRSDQRARVDGLTLDPGAVVNTTLHITAIASSGLHNLTLMVDPDNTINEGGALQESNNAAIVALNILPPPSGVVAIQAPLEGATVTPGATLTVSGFVRDLNVNPIPGVGVRAELVSGANVLATATTTTDASGFFLTTITVPAGTADGTYTVRVTSTATTVSPDTTTINVRAPASFLNTPVPLLGLQWWLFLIILAAVIVAAVAVTMYFKVYGIGKMVECGECGSFVPEDATVCPKCGVEFEKDMAKCSNCGSWIPVDVKQCPECGIEFATGQLDMADYQERMRLQYDEVVRKLQQDASRQLGRALSDQEFQEWWRRQPSFLTFEDWLQEEEDMRKQGSKACPVCGTLNSVTAKVCHKCGSLMRTAAAPVPGAVRAGAPKRALAPAAKAAPPDEGEAPPPANGPVVQKRVVKRGLAEDETKDQSQDNQDL